MTDSHSNDSIARKLAGVGRTEDPSQFPGNSLKIGDRLTDYSNCDILVKRLAAGGAGLVAMGPDRLAHDQWRVVKTMHPDIFRRVPHIRDLFIRESLIWVGLWPHPNIMYAWLPTLMRGNTPFLILTYADYGDLRGLLQRQSFETYVIWAQMIAAGLVALHTPDPHFLRTMPIIHRDLKPENILIKANGYAVITDFGFSKIALAAPEIVEAAQSQYESAAIHSQLYHTQVGAAFGTPQYMAPEQWKDATSAETPTDMYAFGLILSELFAERHSLLNLAIPHTNQAWQDAHQNGKPRPLREIADSLPAEAEDLYFACLAKDPSQRPTASEALRVLQHAAIHLGYQEYSPTPQTRTNANESAHWSNWSAAYYRFGMYEEARERIERAVQLTPQSVEVLTVRGGILQAQGQVDEALLAFDAVLAQLSPDDHLHHGGLWFNRANLLREAKRHAEAEAAYATVAQHTPDSDVLWNNRAINVAEWAIAEARGGRRTVARGYMEQALHHAEHALTLNPTNISQIQKVQKSIIAYRQVLAMFSRPQEV